MRRRAPWPPRARRAAPDQAGTRRRRDQVHAGKIDSGLAERLFERDRQVLQVRAGGELRHDAAELRVGAYLRCDDVGENRPSPSKTATDVSSQDVSIPRTTKPSPRVSTSLPAQPADPLLRSGASPAGRPRPGNLRRRAADSLVGHDRGDVARGRHVEGDVARGHAFRGDRLAGEGEDLARAALFDRDREPSGHARSIVVVGAAT